MIKVRLLKFLRKYKFTHRLLKKYKFFKYSKLDFGLLSVVVPIYNVEKYLERSILSIVKQPYKNIEVICVEDCSTDNSKNILKKLAKKYKNIKVIFNEKNLGLGLSRNKGIKVAKGKWITFLDSDDIVFPFFYSKALLTLSKTKSDFSVGNIYKQNLLPTHRYPTFEKYRAHNIEFTPKKNTLKTTYEKNYQMIWLICSASKIYKKSFFDKYVKGYGTDTPEDVIPNFNSYLNANTFDILKYPSFKYRTRQNSIMSTKRNSFAFLENRLKQSLFCAKILKKKYGTNNSPFYHWVVYFLEEEVFLQYYNTLTLNSLKELIILIGEKTYRQNINQTTQIAIEKLFLKNKLELSFK